MDPMRANSLTTTQKICAGCGKPKAIEDFRRDSSKKDGVRCSCRHCERQRRRADYYANHEENKSKRRKYYQGHRLEIIHSVKASYRRRRASVLEQKAEYRKNNQQKIIQRRKEYWVKNHDILLGKIRAYAKANREKLNASKRAARRANPEKTREISRRWHLNNPERSAQIRRKGFQKHKIKRLAAEREYRRRNVNRKISVSLRNRLNAVLRGNTKCSSVLVLLGCSLTEFKQYFQSKFTDKMSWEKLLAGEIHIDHIIPCADFDLSKAENQHRCFHHTNLQPLWATDNLRKGARKFFPQSLFDQKTERQVPVMDATPCR